MSSHVPALTPAEVLARGGSSPREWRGSTQRWWRRCLWRAAGFLPRVIVYESGELAARAQLRARRRLRRKGYAVCDSKGGSFSCDAYATAALLLRRRPRGQRRGLLGAD
eukprot:gene2559-6945_t